jgi:hypothetical protein
MGERACNGESRRDRADMGRSSAAPVHDRACRFGVGPGASKPAPFTKSKGVAPSRPVRSDRVVVTEFAGR